MASLLADEDRSAQGIEVGSEVALKYPSMPRSKVAVLGGHALVVVFVSERQLYVSC